MAVLALAGLGSLAGGALIPGTFLGLSGSSIGWAIGSAVGNALFGPKPPNGPRLGQQVYQDSTYGTMIPRVWGTDRMRGNVMWVAPVQEHARSVGGKGTPKSKQYSYTVSFAVCLAGHEIDAFSKVWVDGKLVFNLEDGADFETAAASAANIRFYLGTESQLPDPTMEAVEGVGNVPGYRGRAYLVFIDWPYEGRLPDVSATVVESGTLPTQVSWDSYFDLPVPLDDTDNSVLGFWSVPCYADTSGIYVARMSRLSALSTYGVTVGMIEMLIVQPSGTYQVIRTWAPSGGYKVHIGNDSSALSQRQVTSQNHVRPGIALCIYNDDTTDWEWQWFGADALDGGGQVSGFLPDARKAAFTYACSLHADGFYWVEQPTASVYRLWVGNTEITVPSAYQFIGDSLVEMYPTEQYVYVLIHKPVVGWKLLQIETATNTVLDMYDSSTEGKVIGFIDDDHYIGIKPSSGSQVWKTVVSTGAFTEQFADDITTAHGATFTPEEAHSSITSRAGFFNYSDNACVFYTSLWEASGPGFASVHFYKKGITLNTVTIGRIVGECCELAGLDAAQYDTSELTYAIQGFSVTQQTSARSIIEPLLALALADGVESDGKVKFAVRGGAAAAALDNADLGAFEDGATSPSVFPIRRAQETEIPVQIVVTYKDSTRDYQDNSQESVRRVSDALHTDSVGVPAVISGEQAKYFADVKVYENLVERLSAGPLATHIGYAYLEPTDVITDASGDTWRITKKDESLGGLITFEAVAVQNHVYTQPALTIYGGEAIGQDSVAMPGITRLELMDIPLLRDQDDGYLIYAAVSNNAAAWPGVEVYRSLDGGGSWDSLYVTGTDALVGNADSVLADWTGGFLTDEGVGVTVQTDGGTLSSVTYDQALGFSNLCLLGNELLVFRTATLISAGRYQLTGLLRGLFGTEWACSGHARGERFVMIDDTTLFGVPETVTQVGVEQYYKAVSIGNTLEITPAQAFTYSAASKKPYAPVDARAFSVSSGIDLHFVRRMRLDNLLREYASMPIGEDSEAYEIDILDSGTVVRTLTGTSSPINYPSAAITTDFGSTPATLDVAIYQMSAHVGRGFALQTTLTVI